MSELPLPDPDAGADLPPSVWCLRCEDQPAEHGSRFCGGCAWKNELDAEDERLRR